MMHAEVSKSKKKKSSAYLQQLEQSLNEMESQGDAKDKEASQEKKTLAEKEPATTKMVKRLSGYSLAHLRRDAPSIVRLYIPVLAPILLVLFSVALLDYYRVPLSGFNGKAFLPHDNLVIPMSDSRYRHAYDQIQAPSGQAGPRWAEYHLREKHGKGVDSILSHTLVICLVVLAIFLFLLGGSFALLYLYTHGYSSIISTFSAIPYVFYLFVFPLVYVQELTIHFNLAIDWPSLLFLLYNLTVTGIVVHYWAGPNWAKQVGHILVSSSLALFLLKFLNEPIEIALMVLLICWDLYAVLHSSGPLFGLLNSQDTKDLIPTVFQMTISRKSNPDEQRSSKASQKEKVAKQVESTIRLPARPLGASPLEHFELGQGDFIFYCILVAKAYIYGGPMGAIFSLLFLFAGLTITVLLLTATGAALPAIPIPVALGLIGQLMATYLSGPLSETLYTKMIYI